MLQYERSILAIVEEHNHIEPRKEMHYTRKVQFLGRHDWCVGLAGGKVKTMKSEDSERVVEEIAECRAVEVGIEDFAECLCLGPNACEYALPFGYAFLCKHPRMNEILENTRKAGVFRTGAH